MFNTQRASCAFDFIALTNAAVYSRLALEYVAFLKFAQVNDPHDGPF